MSSSSTTSTTDTLPTVAAAEKDEGDGKETVLPSASSQSGLGDVESMDSVGLDVLPAEDGGNEENGGEGSHPENPKSNLKKGAPTSPPSMKKKVSFAPLEMEKESPPSRKTRKNDDEEGNGDEFDDEIDRLLDQGSQNGSGASHNTTDGASAKTACGRKSSCCRLCSPYKIGNCTVLCPGLYHLTNERIGIVGPHWWGASCTLALLWGVSFHFIRRAARLPLPSFVLTLGFTAFSTVALFFVACTNPGIVTARSLQPPSTRSSNRTASSSPSSPRRRTRGSGAYSGISQNDDDDDPADDDATANIDFSDWRYCDLCSVYQPPDAAHCPECNVCVAGYDHHCPWMGTCIGKNNMRAFIVFNSSWFIYLIYAIAWITFIGPTFHKLKSGDDFGGGDDAQMEDAQNEEQESLDNGGQ